MADSVLSSEAGDCFARLPLEVVRDILGRVNLASGNTILRCMEVSREWAMYVKMSVIMVKFISLRPVPVGPDRGLAQFCNLQSLVLEKCKPEQDWTEILKILGSHCAYLESLRMKVDPGLSEDHAAVLFQSFPRLKHLDIEMSLAISDLPVLEAMPLLETFTLKHIRRLTHVHSFGVATSIRHLAIIGCDQMPAPPPLDALHFLRSLDLSRSYSLKHLPALAHLSFLERLDLSYCRSLSVLDLPNSLPFLHTLSLRGCTALSSLSVAPSARFPQLLSLDLLHCPLINLLKHTPSILRLSLSLTRSNHFIQLSKLQRLQTLELQVAQTAASFQGMLPDLESLVLIQSEEVIYLQVTHRTRKAVLRALEVSNCWNMVGLNPIDGPELLVLSGLEDLVLRSCPAFACFPSFSSLTSLRNLHLSSCQSLQAFPQDGVLPSLEHLSIFSCSSLQLLPRLASLPALVKLQMSGCKWVKGFPSSAEKAPRSLTHISIDNCSKLQSLPPFHTNCRLGKLHVTECPSLVTLPNLEHLTNLQSLDLSKTGLSHLPELPPSIVTLTLNWCLSLYALPRLEHLHSLEVLSLEGAVALMGLPPLEGLWSLKALLLHNCISLVRLPSLAGLSSLEVLDVRSCSELRQLPDLDGLSSLKKLDARNCGRMRNVAWPTPGLGRDVVMYP